MAWWHKHCSGDWIDQFVRKSVNIWRSPAKGAPHISKVQVCVRRCGCCSEMSDCSANSNFGEQPGHEHPTAGRWRSHPWCLTLHPSPQCLLCNLRGGAITRAGWRNRPLWCSLSPHPYLTPQGSNVIKIEWLSGAIGGARHRPSLMETSFQTGPDTNRHHCPYNDDRELYLPGSGPAHECPKAPEKDPSGKSTTLTLI